LKRLQPDPRLFAPQITGVSISPPQPWPSPSRFPNASGGTLAPPLREPFFFLSNNRTKRSSRKDISKRTTSGVVSSYSWPWVTSATRVKFTFAPPANSVVVINVLYSQSLGWCSHLSLFFGPHSPQLVFMPLHLFQLAFRFDPAFPVSALRLAVDDPLPRLPHLPRTRMCPPHDQPSPPTFCPPFR